MNEASLEGPVLIEIQESDIAFESEGSGRWTKIDDSYQPEVTNTFGAGWWLVDRDIEPGLYRTEGEISYLARLSGLTGEFGDILANEASPEGPMLIEIKATDVAFQTQGDAVWTLVDESYQPDIAISFGPGWWLVGLDIEPGLYRTEGDVSYTA